MENGFIVNGHVPMRDFENIKSKEKLVLNNATNKDSPSSGDYPESVILESSAKPSLTQDNHN